MTSDLLTEPLRQAFTNRLERLYLQNFCGILRTPDDIPQLAKDSLDLSRSLAQLRLVESESRVTPSGRILEVGSGVGLTVAAARLILHTECYGLEPEADDYTGTFAVSRDLMEALSLPRECIIRGVGESMPFPDAHFDMVISSNVLEHTQDPGRVVAEALRVLKDGGILHFVVPNYGSWWEGHYGVPWLPHMPRWLAKRYVAALGRDPNFIDTLQFITPGMLRRILIPYIGQIEILGWGQELFERRLRTLDFAEYASLGKLKSLLRWLHKVGLVGIGICLARFFNWQTPLVLTLRKTAPMPSAAIDQR